MAEASPGSTPADDAFDRYLELLRQRPQLADNPPGGIQIVTNRAEVARIEAAMAERFAASGKPRAWAKAGLMYEDPYIMLLRDAVIFPDNQPGLYHRAIAHNEEPTGVAVLARYEGKIVLIRQFRHPGRRWHIEIPRGAVGGGEDPAKIGAMEIAEEIGGTIRSLQRLGTLHGASALMRHSVVLFYGELETIGSPALGEGISEILLASPEEFERMILDSAITDSFTVGAAFHARLRGLI